MKVLICAPAWGSGGIEAYYVNAFKHLQNTDIKFSVASFNKLKEVLFEEPLRELGVPFSWLSDNSERVSISERRDFLLSEIEQQKPDIVHLNLSSGMSFYFGHKIKQRFPSVKVIHHAHGDRLRGRNSIFTLAQYVVFGFWRWLYEKEADYRIGCSQQIFDWAYTKRVTHSGNKNNVGIIHPALDIEQYRFNPSAREACRKNLGISDGTILVGTVGRICFQKNSLFIVDIVKKLADKNLGFKFLWVGLGEYEQVVKDKAHKLGLDDKIIFFGISNDIPSLLSAMDIFILPSRWEGLPLIGVEAQTSGLYAIASDTITPEAKLADGKYFVLPLGNAGIWADKIAEISGKDLTDRTSPEKELEAGGFTMEKSAANLEKIYRMLYAEKEERK